MTSLIKDFYLETCNSWARAMYVWTPRSLLRQGPSKYLLDWLMPFSHPRVAARSVPPRCSFSPSSRRQNPSLAVSLLILYSPETLVAVAAATAAWSFRLRPLGYRVTSVPIATRKLGSVVRLSASRGRKRVWSWEGNCKEIQQVNVLGRSFAWPGLIYIYWSATALQVRIKDSYMYRSVHPHNNPIYVRKLRHRESK